MDRGRIVLVNDRAEELFGWPRADLLGQPAEVLLSEAARIAYDERQLPRSANRAPGPMGTISNPIRRYDGSEFPAEVTLAVVDSVQGQLVVAVVRDLTDRARADAEQAQLRADAD